MSLATTERGVIPQTGRDARLMIRRGELGGPTSGLAPGYVQGNLAILPDALATDFLRFCQLNPKPCPLLAPSAPGDPRLPAPGEDLDIPTDLPRHRVWRNGEVVDEPTDIGHWWRDDLVAFVIGCSFSFEEALVDSGIELRHISCDCAVPMYRTTIATVPAGPFRGPMVVSMRPMKPADAIRAIQVTTRFPTVHGAPVHIGKPELIGNKGPRQPRLGGGGAGPDGGVPGFGGGGGAAAVGGGARKAGFLHHELPGQHGGARPPQRRAGDHVTAGGDNVVGGRL